MSKSEIKVIVISNIVFEPYLRLGLEQIFREYDRDVCLIRIAYEEYAVTDMIRELHNADIVFIALNFEEFYPNYINDIYSKRITSEDIINDAVYKSRELYMFLKSKSYAPFFWLGFEDYYCRYDIVMGNVILENGIVDSINSELNKLVSIHDTFLDLKRLIAHVGIVNAYDSKGKYRWNAPYSKEFIYVICHEIFKQYSIHIGDTKKCIVLDCDNVLWGGVLSEDGIEKIHLGNGLGRSYQDFQIFLLMLYYHGVILAVCSKNDEEDVLRVFREHSGMILREEHIASFKINWNNKSDNIRLISDELNIGLDSMIFVDDSEFEIHLVESMLPEVFGILYKNRDNICDKFSCFNLKANVDINKVKQRNETYRTNRKRSMLKEQCTTYAEYLKSLETKVDIHIIQPNEFARIAELTQRTNKCTNGIRYTVAQLKQKTCSDGYKLYSVLVSDKFSNLGIVGAIGIDEDVLDLFSLSCRALGRNIEEIMFEFLRKNNVLSYTFVSTHKNDDLDFKIKENLLKS